MPLRLERVVDRRDRHREDVREGGIRLRQRELDGVAVDGGDRAMARAGDALVRRAHEGDPAPDLAVHPGAQPVQRGRRGRIGRRIKSRPAPHHVVGGQLVAILGRDAGTQPHAIARAVLRDVEALGEHGVEACHVLYEMAVRLDQWIAQQLVVELHVNVPVHHRAPRRDAGKLVGVVAAGEAQRRHDYRALVDRRPAHAARRWCLPGHGASLDPDPSDRRIAASLPLSAALRRRKGERDCGPR